MKIGTPKSEAMVLRTAKSRVLTLGQEESPVPGGTVQVSQGLDLEGVPIKTNIGTQIGAASAVMQTRKPIRHGEKGTEP